MTAADSGRRSWGVLRRAPQAQAHLALRAALVQGIAPSRAPQPARRARRVARNSARTVRPRQASTCSSWALKVGTSALADTHRREKRVGRGSPAATANAPPAQTRRGGVPTSAMRFPPWPDRQTRLTLYPGTPTSLSFDTARPRLPMPPSEGTTSGGGKNSPTAADAVRQRRLPVPRQPARLERQVAPTGSRSRERQQRGQQPRQSSAALCPNCDSQLVHTRGGAQRSGPLPSHASR